MTGVLLLTIAAPFGVLYGVHLIKNGNYSAHKDIQIITFIVSSIGVLTLEGLIRFSGGSGSLTINSPYSQNIVFKIILTAHIIGAVITYLIWTYQLIYALKKERDELPGIISIQHIFLGKIIVFGLFYTAVSALIVYVMTLGLI